MKIIVISFFLSSLLISGCFHTKISDPKESCLMAGGLEWKRWVLTNTSSSKKLKVTYVRKEKNSKDLSGSVTLEPGEVHYICEPKNATLSIVGEREED